MKNRLYLIILTFIFLLLAKSFTLAQNTNKLLRKGNKDYKEQKYNNATESYTKALQQSPKEVRAAFNLGDSYFMMNELDKAKDMYQQSASLTNNTDIKAKAFYNIGNVYYKQAKWEESAQAYKQSLKYNPKDMEAKYNLMMALSKIKKDKNGGGGKNNKDKKDDKKEQDKQQQNQQNQNKQQNQQHQNSQGDNEQQIKQQQQSAGQMSDKQAEQLLEAISADEAKTQEKVNKQKAKPVKGKILKDW